MNERSMIFNKFAQKNIFIFTKVIFFCCLLFKIMNNELTMIFNKFAMKYLFSQKWDFVFYYLRVCKNVFIKDDTSNKFVIKVISPY